MRTWSSRPPRTRPAILYVDLHLVHEVTSPQAFTALRERGLPVRRPDRTVATMDHSTPTVPRGADGKFRIIDAQAAAQIAQLETNCRDFGIELFALGSEGQGIVHVIGPELGLTQPGTHHRLRRQPHQHPRRLRRARLRHRHQRGGPRAGHPVPAAAAAAHAWPSPSTGSWAPGVTAKDIILAVIARIGIGGGTGHVIEYRGSAIRGLSMEERMTVCNMSIEAGARAGLVRARRHHLPVPGRAAPRAPRAPTGTRALARWRRSPATRARPSTARSASTPPRSSR